MSEFKVGDKVRVNEGKLEGQSGFVNGIDREEGLIYVELEDVGFAKEIAFYPETLVSADDVHGALEALSLHPEIVNVNHLFKVTTVVGGIMYQSLPIHVTIIPNLLANPPAGLYAVEYMEKDKARKGSTVWRTLWTEA